MNITTHFSELHKKKYSDFNDGDEFLCLRMNGRTTRFDTFNLYVSFIVTLQSTLRFSTLCVGDTDKKKFTMHHLDVKRHNPIFNGGLVVYPLSEISDEDLFHAKLSGDWEEITTHLNEKYFEWKMLMMDIEREIRRAHGKIEL